MCVVQCGAEPIWDTQWFRRALIQSDLAFETGTDIVESISTE